ncbi:MAG: metal-sensitive transcriptional regulator [Candidatus Falkowbacteria bacterium]
MDKQDTPAKQANIIKKIDNRLARLEGQVRGVRRMLDEGKACDALIIQLSAIRQAATNIATEVLGNEMICKLERGESPNKTQLQNLFKLK